MFFQQLLTADVTAADNDATIHGIDLQVIPDVQRRAVVVKLRGDTLGSGPAAGVLYLGAQEAWKRFPDTLPKQRVSISGHHPFRFTDDEYVSEFAIEQNVGLLDLIECKCGEMPIDPSCFHELGSIAAIADWY